MKQNDILFILISSALLTIAWIGFSVFHNLHASTLSAPLAVQVTPIFAHFDTTALTKLKARKQLPSLAELDISSTVPSPTPTGTQLISPSPSPGEITPVATSSGSSGTP